MQVTGHSEKLKTGGMCLAEVVVEEDLKEEEPAAVEVAEAVEEEVEILHLQNVFR